MCLCVYLAGVSVCLDWSVESTASSALCVELVSVLNHCGPVRGEVASALLDVVLQWIHSSSMSLLLLPMMSSACQCLASTAHMSRVVEACCETYFTRGMNSPQVCVHVS